MQLTRPGPARTPQRLMRALTSVFGQMARLKSTAALAQRNGARMRLTCDADFPIFACGWRSLKTDGTLSIQLDRDAE